MLVYVVQILANALRADKYIVNTITLIAHQNDRLLVVSTKLIKNCFTKKQ